MLGTVSVDKEDAVLTSFPPARTSVTQVGVLLVSKTEMRETVETHLLGQTAGGENFFSQLGSSSTFPTCSGKPFSLRGKIDTHRSGNPSERVRAGLPAGLGRRKVHYCPFQKQLY